MIGAIEERVAENRGIGSSNVKRIGRYEVLRVVNRGGMGEIALGRVTGTKGFEKLVVLKRLRADAERDDHFEMFDVEQEVMSRIEHPNIVKVFDQPVIDKTQYLAMEYVRGRNLDQVIRQANFANETLSLRFTLSVLSEILRGLAFVHRLKDNDGKALGVVHQDMTPSNVMVSFFGEVKITDFGISYVTSRDGGLRKGVLKGKPRYVAPEVLAGKRVNNQADIYGVGVVLYELLAGKALFARASVKETLAAVARNELPDFEEEFPAFGEGVWQLLSRSLKKDPQDRYRTAEEMAADVFAELTKLGGPLPPAAIGYQVQKYFANDPDVPEMDPAFKDAIASSEQSQPGVAQQEPSGLNLAQTLEELDRLLGPESVDLFTLPPELEKELQDIQEAEPFLAKTPLPDFVWEVQTEAEILDRANATFGAPGGVREAPPLFDNQAPPRMPPPIQREGDREEESTEYARIAKPKRSVSGQYMITKPGAPPEEAEAQEEPEAGAAKAKAELKIEAPIEAEDPTTEDAGSPAAPVRATPARAASVVPEATSEPVSIGPAQDRFWFGIIVGLVIGLVTGALLYAQLTGR